MNKTENYALPQWEAHDPLRREDFNAAMADIDAAVAAAGKALADYRSSIDAALAKKAEQAALNALQDSLTSANSTVAALSAALGSGGENCRIATGGYVGDGAWGPDNPTSLTFPFKPIWVMIGRTSGTNSAAPAPMNTSFLLRPMWAASSTNGKSLHVTWTDTGVSWHCDAGISDGAYSQNNTADEAFYWVALGVDG